MKTISGIEFASEHNGTDVFRLIELAYEQGQKDVIEQLPPALGTNLAEVGMDLISRQQAIDAVNSRKTAEQSSAGIMRNAVVDFCVDIIKKLPPAQPKIGRWIHDGSKWTNRWICSNCGYKWFFDCIEGAYCPNCGSDMREVTT